jgi:tetratricopeptide (TPR) repeat protein
MSSRRSTAIGVAQAAAAVLGLFIMGCGASPQEKADSAVTRGDGLMAQGKPGEALVVYQEALGRAQKAHEKAQKNGQSVDLTPFTAKVHDALKALAEAAAARGRSQLAQADPAAAARSFQEAADYAQRAGLDTSSYLGMIGQAYLDGAERERARGDALLSQGDPVQALSAYRQALDWAQKAGTDTGSLQAKIKDATRASAEASASRGDAHLAQGRTAEAMNSYRSALDHAQKAGIDTAPYQAKITAARTASAEEARRRVQQAREVVASDAARAERLLDEARRLAGPEFGNDSAVQGQIDQVWSSRELVALRVNREVEGQGPGAVDAVTERINTWLFARQLYSGDLNSWGSYWRLESYLSMVNSFAALDSRLAAWEALGSVSAVRARSQLSAMRSGFDTWRTVAMLSPAASQIQGMLLIAFIQRHLELKTTLRGTRDINFFSLQDSWGISYNGTGSGGFSWSGTGSGGGPGPGGGGSGTGGGGTGSGGTSPGTGNGSTSTGTGPGTGSPDLFSDLSRGSGTTSGSGSGGAGSGTGGAGTGSGQTGAGTSTGSAGTSSGTGRRSGTGTASSTTDTGTRGTGSGS